MKLDYEIPATPTSFRGVYEWTDDDGVLSDCELVLGDIDWDGRCLISHWFTLIKCRFIVPRDHWWQQWVWIPKPRWQAQWRLINTTYPEIVSFPIHTHDGQIGSRFCQLAAKQGIWVTDDLLALVSPTIQTEVNAYLRATRALTTALKQ